MTDENAPDAHLAVVVDKASGLFHGALYVNSPTPSGCVRYLLRTTTNPGRTTERAAAEDANRAFPDVEPLDLSAAGSDDVSLEGVAIPRGALVTRISPRRHGDPQEEAPQVEVTLRGKRLPVSLSVSQFERMLLLGHLYEESTSGRDPGLYYVYEHYLLSEAGQAAVGAKAA